MNIFYKNNGGITVFVSMLLIPMILFAFIVIDGIRIYGGKAILEDTVKLTSNTGLADYNKALKDAYGILAISKDENELTNNLLNYFDSTISSMGFDLEAEDSYTISIINDIKQMINTGKLLEFNNIINLETLDFKVSGVDGSQIYNPYVVKRQIVDYMKYRGLLSIGEGFLNKVSVFKELPKQQKVLDSKVQYESELNNIEKTCKKVYDRMLELESNYNTLGKYNIKNFISDFENGNEEYLGMKKINDLALNIYLNSLFIDSIDNINIDTKEMEYLDIVDFFNEDSNFVFFEDLNAEDDFSKTNGIIEYYKNLNKNDYNLVEVVKINKVFESKYNTYVENIKDNFEKLTGETEEAYSIRLNEKLDEIEKEYKSVSKLASEYSKKAKFHLEKIFDRKKNVGNFIASEIKKMNSFLGEKFLLVEKIYKDVEDVLNSLKTLKDKIIPLAKEKGIIWKENIAQLSDGNIKSAFEQDYTQIEKNINEKQINTVIKRLEDVKAFYKKKIEMLKEVSFNERVYLYKKNTTSIDEIYEGIVFNWSSNSELEDELEKAKKIYLGYVKIPNIASLGNINKMYYKDTAFYRYLEKSFKAQDKEEKVQKKNKANEEKNSIMQKVNESMDAYKDISDRKIKNIIPVKGKIYEDLASTIYKNITINQAENKFEFSQNINGNNSDKIAKSQMDSMNGSLNVIDGIGQALVDLSSKGRDDILVMEYLTEVFSCHTTKNKQDINIIGNELNKESNYLFGSELEYILWGATGENTNKNTIYTATSIFGLRFILNTIYAYTDAEIRTFTLSIASAIAGFTGFGIPIVQNVLMLVLSMGETAVDLVRLLKGDCVEIYKSNLTWLLKPSNLTKELTSDLLKKSANSSINQLSKCIENIASDYTDKNINNLEEKFDNICEEIIDNLKTEITNLLIIPIQTQIGVVLGNNEEEGINCNEMLDRAYENLNDMINRQEDSYSKKIKQKILGFFMSEKLPYIKTEINKIISNVNNDLIDISDEINNLIEDFIKDISTKVKEVIIDNGYEKIKKQVKNSFRGLTGDINKKINSSIDKFIEDVNPNFFSNQIRSDKEGGVSKIGFNIGLTYKEYIKLFIFVGLTAGKENAYLTRMCDLIKLNLVASDIAPMKDFNLKNAFTTIKMNASINVKTTFMRQEIFKDGYLGNTYQLDFVNVNGY